MPHDLGANPPSFTSPGASHGPIAAVRATRGIVAAAVAGGSECKSELASVASASPPAGLVSLSTSDTKSGHFVIDPYVSRLRRLARGIIGAANLVEEELQEGGVRYRAALAHLTYAPGSDYNPLQIAQALKSLRGWCERRGLWHRYVWRLEFGERSGRLHYHVMIWLPRGVTMPKWDKQGWWPHGATRMEWARAPVGYLAKYASKAAACASQEFNTKGSRWWAVGGLTPWAKARLRITMAPGWVRKIWRAMDDQAAAVKRLPFGWWLIGGWEFRTPWEMVGMEAGGARVRWRGFEHGSYELCSSK
jgi:hypothetical protein